MTKDSEAGVALSGRTKGPLAQLGNSLGAPGKKAGASLEIVLTTEVINGFTGRPRVLAVETW